MIIVKIFQGLGNQMFQYAYGHARASELNSELKLDTSYYSSHSEVKAFGYTYKRDFGLNHFKINATEATSEEIKAILSPRGDTLLQKARNKYREYLGGYQKKFHVKEPSYAEINEIPYPEGETLLQKVRNKYRDHPGGYQKKFGGREPSCSFDKRLLQIEDNTYVEGYFTDERYFAKYRNDLFKKFEPINPPGEKNQALIDQIGKENSVCISIRRTNFLNNPLHGTCGEDYYYSAMDKMASKVPDPVFYVFSDDNTWVNTFFESKYKCVFMQHNYPDFYEDFRLMKQCKHHIIPNSTFPWWAAWLSNYQNKIVIAPEYWLNSDTIDYSRIVPDSWLKLEHTINTKFKGD